eukprot:g181.t1
MSCFFLAWALLLFAKQIEALEGCSVSWDSTEVGVLLQTRRENAKASLALTHGCTRTAGHRRNRTASLVSEWTFELLSWQPSCQLRNSSSFSASRGTGVALVAVPAPLTGRHSTGIFHYGLWSRVHWTHHELPKNWQLQNVLRSAEVFDWTCLAVAFTGAFVLRSLWLWQDPEKPRVSHLASMGLWVLMAALMGFAMWLRFGQESGERRVAGASSGEAGMNWTAGYIFELFFMLENVFVFRYVIHVMSLPPRVLLRDGVVWAQITFEAVFFLGLAHQLRSVHFLPHLLGTGLAIFGVSTLVESAKSEGDGVMSSVIKSVTSSSSIRAVEGPLGFVWERGRLDFMCEIDTVLTKIEEIPPLVDHKVGFEAFQQHQEDLLSVAFGPSLGCVLGHYSLRLAVLIFSHPAERWQQLQEEELPWHWASTVEVLQSGWPIFGLLGLIAYKLSRDGAGKGVVCDQPIESFRIRYEEPESLTRMEEVMLYGKEVPFSTDVENTADELLQRLQSNRTMGRMNRACLLGAGLPLMGYGASISCSARREPGLKQLLEKSSTLIVSREPREPGFEWHVGC